ncbi:FtsX-like permease family protein [Rhodoferax sp. U2-2l]|uniref:ABC transporter permease n=1 Tax=Rhodoferax sp. U2-2l TaxID=2884000 RepID=UPI001D0B86D9|nr:FtsX-like permease family protein [Rhodoferax sp. U2-2l]MCB8747210.1 FtsX-like permease family protein [Rhodoferax sp. U2-2l]
MMTLSLAVRNLLRNRRRSLATLLAMAIGSTSILLFGGFSGNINLEMHTRNVQRGGHLQIQHKDFYLYGNGNPTAYGINDYTKILADIKNDAVLKDLIAVATPTLQFGGIAGNYAASVSRTVIGSGFIPEDINKMRSWNDFNLRSKAPVSGLEGAATDSAIVGTGVARVLQLCDALKIENCPKPEEEAKLEGDALPDDIAQLSVQEAPVAAKSSNAGPPTIDILVVNSRGSANVTSLKVVQAEDQGIKELDEILVMMHLQQIQSLIYGRSAPKVTAIVIQLQHSDQLDAAKARLAPILAKYSASQPLALLDFRELSPFFVQTEQMFDLIFGFVFLLIGGIVLFTVSNTMNTAVVERTVEVGTLRAIGLRRSGIRALFVTEGALLGVGGAVLGAVLALVISIALNHMDLPWIPPGDVKPVPFTVRVWDEPLMIVGTTIGLIFIAVLSAWWPAYRAAQLDVVEALRHA